MAARHGRKSATRNSINILMTRITSLMNKQRCFGAASVVPKTSGRGLDDLETPYKAGANSRSGASFSEPIGCNVLPARAGISVSCSEDDVSPKSSTAPARPCWRRQVGPFEPCRRYRRPGRRPRLERWLGLRRAALLPSSRRVRIARMTRPVANARRTLATTRWFGPSGWNQRDVRRWVGDRD